jgi:hypothetical protein
MMIRILIRENEEILCFAEKARDEKSRRTFASAGFYGVSLRFRSDGGR